MSGYLPGRTRDWRGNRLMLEAREKRRCVLANTVDTLVLRWFTSKAAVDSCFELDRDASANNH